MIAPICPRKGGRVGLISKHSNFWKWYKIYPYSSNERPFKKNAGQVRDDKSPVKLMTVLMNSLNWLPVPGSACLMDIESTSLTVGDRSPLVSFSFLLMLPKKLLPMTKEKGKKTIEGKEKKEKRCGPKTSVRPRCAQEFEKDIPFWCTIWSLSSRDIGQRHRVSGWNIKVHVYLAPSLPRQENLSSLPWSKSPLLMQTTTRAKVVLATDFSAVPSTSFEQPACVTR